MTTPNCPICHDTRQQVTQRGNITETKACSCATEDVTAPAEPVVPPADDTVNAGQPLVITQP